MTNPPNPHDDGSKSLWVVLGVPRMQRDLLQVQLHPHVHRAAANVNKSSRALTNKPDNVLQLWDNFRRCGRLVGCR